MTQPDFSWTEWCTAPDIDAIVLSAKALNRGGATAIYGWSEGQKYEARKVLRKIYEANPDWRPLINHFPWLNAFHSSDFSDDWNRSVQIFQEDANQASAILKEYIQRRSCNALVELAASFEDDGIKWLALERIFDDLATFWNSDEGKLIAQRVVHHCRSAGIAPKTETMDVYGNVASLRDHVLAQTTGEKTSLLARIEELTRKNQQLESEKTRYDQIITSVTYRHALEHLCENTHVPRPRNPGRPTTTERWEQFWRNAVRNNKPGGPIAVLQGSGLTWAQVNDAGLKLFGNLSANIHQYSQNEFDFSMNQWANAVVVGRILQAMKPQNTPGTGADWNVERGRY